MAAGSKLSGDDAERGDRDQENKVPGGKRGVCRRTVRLIGNP